MNKAAIPEGIVDDLAPHLDRLPLTERGRLLVEKALQGPPIRRVHGGPTNIASRAAFKKFRVTNDTESATLEFEHLHLLNADPVVVDVRTQAVCLTVHPDEPLDDGGWKHHGWQIYPDFLVIELERVVLRDLMTEKELREIERTRPWYIARDTATKQWRCPAAEAACAALGIEYEIRTDGNHSRKAARACTYLADFADYEIAAEARDQIAATVDAERALTVGALIELGRARGRWTADDALAAIAQGLVFLDVNVHIPDDHDHAWVYPDAATAREFERVHPPSWAAIARQPDAASVAPGTLYTLGDARVEVFISTGDTVHLRALDHPGCPMVPMARDAFDRAFAVGDLRPAGTETLAEQARQGALAVWKTASPAKQRLASQRWQAVEVQRANRIAVRQQHAALPMPLVAGKVPSERSLERWVARIRDAERSFGMGILGVLDLPRPGRPGRRLESGVETIIGDEIEAYYRQPVGRSKKALAARIRARCRKAGYDAPDPKTVRARLQGIEGYRLRRAREGRKAAYPDKPYAPVDPDAVPTTGLYPHHRVHYDTTVLDVVVRDRASDRLLGRPTLGDLVDAFSDKVLDRGYELGPPTAAALLDALVRYAERFGRLPDELWLDNAKTHWSEALQVFAAATGIHVRYRPAAQGRYGGPVELSFEQITKEVVHQVRGNTKAMKVVRTVTDAVAAKTLAVLELAEVAYLVDLWDDKVGSTRIVKRHGKSPEQAFVDGLRDHGSRPTRWVAADELLRMLALTSRGTRRARGVQGVWIDYVTYHHDCLSCGGIKGTDVEVSIDHRNVVVAYVFVPAHHHDTERIEATWVQAVATSLAHLRVVSRAELELASKILRERLRDDARKRAVREAALAEVLERAEEIESLAIEHRKTAALGQVHPVRSLAADSAPTGGDRLPEPAPIEATDPDPIAALRAQIAAGYLERAS